MRAISKCRSAMFICDHGAHRSPSTCALVLVCAAVSTGAACDHLERVRYVCDLTSCSAKHPDTRTELAEVVHVAEFKELCATAAMAFGVVEPELSEVLAPSDFDRMTTQSQRTSPPTPVQQKLDPETKKEEPPDAEQSVPRASQPAAPPAQPVRATAAAAPKTPTKAAPKTPTKPPAHARAHPAVPADVGCTHKVDIDDDVDVLPREPATRASGDGAASSSSRQDQQPRAAHDEAAGEARRGSKRTKPTADKSALQREIDELLERKKMLQIENDELEKAAAEKEAELDDLDMAVGEMTDLRKTLDGKRMPTIDEACDLVRERRFQDRCSACSSHRSHPRVRRRISHSGRTLTVDAFRGRGPHGRCGVIGHFVWN